MKELFFKTEEEIAQEIEDKEEFRSILFKHEHRILQVIASCQDVGQLSLVNGWITDLAMESDSIILKCLRVAIMCKYYNILQEAWR